MTELSVLLGTVIGGIIGFLSSYFVWRIQTSKKKKDIAHGFYLELESLEEPLEAFAKHFERKPDDTVEVHHPFYTDGLYMTFRQEIFSFKPRLSESLFRFYAHLLRAERFRQIDESNIFFKPLNDAMRRDIQMIYKDMPKLKKLLQEESK